MRPKLRPGRNALKVSAEGFSRWNKYLHYDLLRQAVRPLGVGNIPERIVRPNSGLGNPRR